LNTRFHKALLMALLTYEYISNVQIFVYFETLNETFDGILIIEIEYNII